MHLKFDPTNFFAKMKKKHRLITMELQVNQNLI